MTRVDMHPEELLDTARRGELGAAERRRLEAHLAHCVACRIEHGAMADFDRELAPGAGDDAAASRIVAGVLARAGIAEPGSVPAPAARQASSGRRRATTIAAAGVIVGLFGGAAAAFFALSPARDEAPAAVPDTAPAVTVAPEEPRPAGSSPSDLPQPTPDTCIGDTPECSSAGPPVVEEDVGMPRLVERGREAAAVPSAEELLARGNEARRAGRYDAATRLYRTLQRTHPASREAAVSRVTLGRLLLDGAGEPAAALREFETYLARNPSGVLAEEARVGRALALGRLGRTGQERDAWRDLLAHHPDSLHAERARQRLQ